MAASKKRTHSEDVFVQGNFCKRQSRRDAGVYAVDRFISARLGLDVRADVYRDMLACDAENQYDPPVRGDGAMFAFCLANATIGQCHGGSTRFRVLCHTARPKQQQQQRQPRSVPRISDAYECVTGVPTTSDSTDGVMSATRRLQRGLLPLSQYHERVLDAPELSNDFYANPIAWSERDELVCALGNAVHVWDGVTGCNGATIESTSTAVSSVEWMRLGAPRIAIGTDGPNTVTVCDVVHGENANFTHRLGDHRADRVLSLSASRASPFILASGSGDGMIVLHDLRSPSAGIVVGAAHAGSVCGLRFSHDSVFLASGGADAVVNIWDVRCTGRRAGGAGGGSGFVRRFAESAAMVKALDWCPWSSHLLATGAGSADRHVRVYNTATGELVRDTRTDSQVAGVAWSTGLRALVTAGGYGDARVRVRDRVTLKSAFKFKHRPHRLLGLACTDDGTVACTVDAGELLMFWRLSSRGSRVKAPFPDMGVEPAAASAAKRAAAVCGRLGLQGKLCIR